MGGKKEFLNGVLAVVLEQGLGKARKKILSKQLEANGGGVAMSVKDIRVTHVLVGNTVKHSRLTQLLKVDSIPENVDVVCADWLSSCLVAGEKLNSAPYILKPENSISPQKECGRPVVEKQKLEEREIESNPRPPQDLKKEEELEEKGTHLPLDEGSSSLIESPIKASPGLQIIHTSPLKVSPGSKRTARWIEHDSDSDYVDSGDEGGGGGGGGGDGEMLNPEELTEGGLIRPLQKKGRWMCQIPASELKSQVNYNEHITDTLEELLSTYKSSNVSKDQWRAMSLTKAMTAIKRHPKEITSYEEARSIPFVGDRLADKIHEIITSGHLRRLDLVDKEKKGTIERFQNIHGVGTTTAEQFYAKGYRTLEDLETAGVLNRVQKIGIKYYHEFQDRMPRSEAEEIEGQVRETGQSISKGLQVVTCGSYRRGKPTCGDVDILVTHPDGRSHKGVFTRLIQKLKDNGFLTDDLTIHDDTVDGSGKYLGVCKLPGEERKHRRIDIYVCPYAEYPLMLLHFTGSGHFNRSMRNRADKMGMSLSEHSLNAGVIRKSGVKIFEGTPLPVFSEEDVFKYLDMKYLEPHDRDLP